MNKADLIKELEKRLGSRKGAVDAIEGVFDTILREVARGGKVSITGFGTFTAPKRAARTGRNPRTGAAIKIKAAKVPKFRPGKGLRDAL